VVDETLRLYPPAWITNRQAIAEDEILGHRIPAKSFVSLSPYVLHRHPDFWERPDAFDPERFAPGRDNGRPRFAYFPFGGGPRQCIGQSMALVEAQLVLATVLARCRLRPASHRPVEAEALATLRPRDGLRMIVEAA
ncbi:MAG: Cytochrome P450, partial [uncultured Rubrobacteraceae bacterium]